MPYQSAMLRILAELVPWNRFLGSLKVKKFGLSFAPARCRPLSYVSATILTLIRNQLHAFHSTAIFQRLCFYLYIFLVSYRLTLNLYLLCFASISAHCPPPPPHLLGGVYLVYQAGNLCIISVSLKECPNPWRIIPPLNTSQHFES